MVSRRKVGVEEELLLVDAGSGAPRAVAGAVLELYEAQNGTREAGTGEALEAELQCEQLETGTRPCQSMDDLEGEIRRWRRTASDKARLVGAEVAALATSPLPVEPSLSPKPRYRLMAEEFAITAQEQLTCGCHVHVEVDSDEEGVAVLDRLRPWLAPLLALSANSPFWQGRDSGYSSYRSQVWGRWPSAGPVEPFGSAKGYHDTVRALLDSGTLLDEGMVYFDARLSRAHPTVEIRIPDVCLDASDAVLVAALTRALVDTAVRDWRAGAPPAEVSTAVLRMATWRAGRSGLRGQLLHPATLKPQAAEVVTHDLLHHAARALADNGDLDLVTQRLRQVHRRGNGSEAQRAALKERGDLAGVVTEAVARTLA